METDAKNPSSQENQATMVSKHDSKEQSTTKEVFINHAEIHWNEMRRQWIGDQSQRSKRMSREPIMSWTTTYEDLLSSTEPFQQPVPLSEMVDFLVDIWLEEGLYD